MLLQAVEIQRRIRIRLRDGVCLNAHLYRPGDHTEPTACIVALTPYTADHLHDRGMCFASHGMSFLAVDVRGRGDSQGAFVPHRDDRLDGYDVVEWVARQHYCNGKVAMYGGSYLGSAQWATAGASPPHLTTITPTAAPFLGVDVPFRNNIFASYEVRWLTFISGRVCQAKRFTDQALWLAGLQRWFESGRPFRELDRFVGEPSEIFQKYLDHPEQGTHWDALNPTAQDYARMDMPILTITGIYDGDQPGALEHYRQHIRYATAASRASHYLIIGPWNHTGCTVPSADVDGLTIGAAGVLDLYELHAQWFSWTMQDGAKPDFLRDLVSYYVTGAEHWRHVASLEEVTAHREPLYLQSDVNPTDVFHSGSLAKTHGGERPADEYVYDPADVSLAVLETTLDAARWIVDQRLLHASHGRQLIYHTAPFEADTEVSGFFRFVAWIAIDQPDTDFRVSIYEIDAQGGSVFLTNDSLRARYRDGLRYPRLIDTTEPLRYEFDRFTFTSRLILKGHRLRLTIGPLDSIHSQRNYNSGRAVADESRDDARTVRVRLFHDGAHPSVLHVPHGRVR